MSGRGSMALALCLASSHALSPRTICSRRGALYGAAAALSHPASVRTSAAAVVPPSSGLTDTTAAADVSARLNAGVRAMDVLLRDWDELTIDCTYAEVPRALLETKNKELLLEKASACVENKLAQPPASWLSGGYFQHQASTLALFDKSTSITVCKSSNRQVRAALEPLGKLAEQLQTASVAESIRDKDFEAFLAAAEGYESAISAADAAAYLAQKDYSANTAFKQGETPSTANLDAARASIADARDELAALSKLVRR